MSPDKKRPKRPAAVIKLDDLLPAEDVKGGKRRLCFGSSPLLQPPTPADITKFGTTGMPEANDDFNKK